MKKFVNVTISIDGRSDRNHAADVEVTVPAGVSLEDLKTAVAAALSSLAAR